MLIMAIKKTWMRERLEALDKKPADLIRALGLQKRTSSVFEMLKGDRQLQPREYAPAATFFELDLQTIIALSTGQPVESMPPPRRSNGHRMDADTPTLLVWKSGPNKGGRIGGFVLYSEKAGRAGIVRRPDFLDHSENAFAFKVVNDKHADAFRTRDIALVNPDDPVTAEDDCLFTDQDRLDVGAETIIATLLRDEPDQWIVRQGDTDMKLPKAEFPDAWRIVGKYSRR